MTTTEGTKVTPLVADFVWISLMTSSFDHICTCIFPSYIFSGKIPETVAHSPVDRLAFSAICFKKIHRQTAWKGGEERDLPSAFSLPKWFWWTKLGRAEAKNLELHATLPHGWQGHFSQSWNGRGDSWFPAGAHTECRKCKWRLHPHTGADYWVLIVVFIFKYKFCVRYIIWKHYLYSTVYLLIWNGCFAKTIAFKFAEVSTGTSHMCSHTHVRTCVAPSFCLSNLTLVDLAPAPQYFFVVSLKCHSFALKSRIWASCCDASVKTFKEERVVIFALNLHYPPWSSSSLLQSNPIQM